MKKLATHRRSNARLKLAGALALALTCGVANAETPPTAYRLAAIVDQAHGHDVVAGDYDAAIPKLQDAVERRWKWKGFETNNNLCVALVASGRLADATDACDRAVDLQHGRYTRARDPEFGVRRDYAIALSNRGVLRALQGDTDGARADFLKAVEQRAHLDEARDNLARLRAVTRDGVAAA